MDLEPEEALLDAPALVRRLYGARGPGRAKQPPSGETDSQRLKRVRGELSAVDLQVLVALSEDCEQTVEQVAQRLALRPSTVSHAVNALKAAEFISDDPLPGGHHRQRRRPLTRPGKSRASDLVAEARRLLDDHPQRNG